MDEPEDLRGDREKPPSLLPALLLTWLAVYLCVALGMWWYTRLLPPEPLLALRIHGFALGSLALLFLAALFGARGERTEAAEPEAWLCQHCLKPYVPGAHFCPRCGAPKTFYSGVSPYERAHAQAWILGKAAHHPSRRLHVVCLSVGAGVSALAALATILLGGAWEGGTGMAVFQSLLVLATFALQAYVYGALCVLCLANWRRRRRGQDPRQPEIDYGAPPWFSFDTEWALPEFEEDPEGDATTAAG